MRKGSTAAAPVREAQDDLGWIDLSAVACVRVTSEDANHPIEAALRASASTGWRAALPGEQSIWIDFDAPRRIRQISLGFSIAKPRTHEFLLSWSCDGGVSYRQLARQQFNFSPSTPCEEENYVLDVGAVTDLKLVIRPDLSNNRAHATLRHLHLR